MVKKDIFKDNQEKSNTLFIICGVLNGIILLKILIMYILCTCRVVNILVNYTILHVHYRCVYRFCPISMSDQSDVQ